MEQISKIANSALDKITKGEFVLLQHLAITGLLNDFQYAWLKRLNIPFKFDVLDLARDLCNGYNKEIFKVTHCRSIKAIRHKFSGYIKKWHNNDYRVIISLSYDYKNNKIDSDWIDLNEYKASQVFNGYDRNRLTNQMNGILEFQRR